jgi:hypothetical protein
MCCAQRAPALRTIGQYSISYAVAVFKELHFQTKAAELAEAAKPETPALVMSPTANATSGQPTASSSRSLSRAQRIESSFELLE